MSYLVVRSMYLPADAFAYACGALVSRLVVVIGYYYSYDIYVRTSVRTCGSN